MTPPEKLADAVAASSEILDRVAGRVVIGLAGPPGAGKSTLSLALASALRARYGPAVAVPMDGFHLANTELARLGLTDRKGAPETFDAAGFVHLLRRLRAPTEGEVVYAPSFNRTLNESIGSAIAVAPSVRTVIVEGNYLLLSTGHWSYVRPLLDLAIYLDAPDTTRTPSLLRRQRARGLDDAAAHDWVFGSDEANARLIAQSRPQADLVLSRS